MDKVKTAWFDLLDGAIEYNGVDVKVYREDVDIEETGHYILLETESESDARSKESKVRDVVLLVNVVTAFDSRIQDGVVDEIDDDIRALVFADERTHTLPAQSGIQIVTVKASDGVYLKEGNQVKRFYRKVTRYTHRIIEQ